MRKRMNRSLAHVENMKEAYVEIVRKRLSDRSIKLKKKMSFGQIAGELNLAGFRAPMGGPITYLIVQRLSEITGQVELLAPEPLVQKSSSELGVGDCVRVISAKRHYVGEVGIIRKVADDRRGFQVELRMRSSKLYAFFAGEVEHLPDDRHFYEPISLVNQQV